MMKPNRMIAIPLPAEVADALDNYVFKNAVTREAVITAALIMFQHSWSQMGVAEGEE
jgi:hypothetical protein